MADTTESTGVSNGDVDWLFRGKSKKLTKKKPEKELKEDSIKSAINTPTVSKPNTPSTSKTPSIASPPVSKTTSNDPAFSDRSDDSTTIERQPSSPIPSTPKNQPIAKSPLSQEIPAPENVVPKKSNLTSQMDKLKLGRARSSSTGSQSPIEPQIRTTRASSLAGLETIIPPQKQPLSSSPLAIPSKSLQAPSSPIEGLARSNSGSKKSLFGSFASKFKSSSKPINPPNVPSSLSNTVSNVHESVSPTNKPAVGIPISGSRKGSITSLPPMSPKTAAKLGSSMESNQSVEKDKSFFGRKIRASSLVTGAVKQQDRVVLNKNKNREPIALKELTDVKLRRVTFAIDKLLDDPQQQIPSRRPKKGNVLIPEDLLAGPPRLSLGISLNGETATAAKVNEKELAFALDAQRKAIVEAEKHAQEAHLAAKRMAIEVSHLKFRNIFSKELDKDVEDEEEEEEDSHGAEKIEIDKPLHLHEHHFDDEEEHQDTGSMNSNEEISLETIYTRCCHLREILPIPATLKQLRNKTKPLQIFKLLNPRPTLIDVLSFSDFIAIVPIITIVFDNVTMTTEMLKCFLASLVNSNTLEKLSLRNVAIDKEGWRFLCKFLSRNKSLKKLDISQQRIKSDTPTQSIRGSMNWDLFINSLIVRGGIEELVINGSKLSDKMFESLIENGVKISTQRLGIASIDLNLTKSKIITDWINEKSSKCIGVDIAFNDLSQGQLKPFINTFNDNSKLVFFSLHSTNLTNVDETALMLRALAKIPTLRFLDLSSIPHVYPEIIPYLNKYLPRFQNLRRIHFDLNELTSSSINAIAQILRKCQNLIHVSFLGNRNLTESSAAALYSCVKNSDIYTLDLDYDLISDELSKRLAFYLMRNMERTMNTENMISHDSPEDLIFDGSILMRSAERLLETDNPDDSEKLDEKTQKIITDALIERTRSVRSDIHKTIDSLFERRNNDELTLEMKEMLLRFCLLDSSLEKLVNLFEEDGPVTENSSTSMVQNINNPAIESFNEHLHEDSSALISSGTMLSPDRFQESFNGGYFPNQSDVPFEPHQVVVDSSSDGKTVAIDDSTGRPVLMRSISQTSDYAKRQEEEEGEFHRWGFFVQQQNSLYPDDPKGRSGSISGVLTPSQDSSLPSKAPPVLTVLPSGSELREAIIKAKGIESVSELIERINLKRVNIAQIYNQDRQPSIPKNTRPSVSSTGSGNTLEIPRSPHPSSPLQKDQIKCEISDNVSIDSMDVDGTLTNSRVNAVVDEAYDKLLNEAQRVRSNR